MRKIAVVLAVALAACLAAGTGSAAADNAAKAPAKAGKAPSKPGKAAGKGAKAPGKAGKPPGKDGKPPAQAPGKGGKAPDKPIVLKASKGDVTYDHGKHAKLECRVCHHKDEAGREQACSKCHTGKAEGRKPDAREAFHKQCRDCHKEWKKGPTKCDGCHK